MVVSMKKWTLSNLEHGDVHVEMAFIKAGTCWQFDLGLPRLQKCEK
jgi:hypothetical protein